MQLVRSAQRFPFGQVANGSVATIGAFDGLHLGHQDILRQVMAEAKRRSLPSIVMSFEPTPKEFFSAAQPPARLMRFREKFDALAEFGIDMFFCPRFNEVMRNISPDAFIRQILVHAMNIRHLEIGDDFRFARRRAGDFDQLERAGNVLGYSVHKTGSVMVGGERASSTAVRQALWTGDLERATRMLGRPYRMSGHVIEGRKIGRTLGYPTANVDLRRRQTPVMGIFAVQVRGVTDRPLNGVASVGTRPTFDLRKPLLEVHLFDFEGEFYGNYIHVDFIGRIRDEVKFANISDLVAQMHKDSEMARAILAAWGSQS